MIRVELPQHLRTLAKVGGEVFVDAGDDATLGGVLEAIDVAYPMLRGTIRDQRTGRRRDFVRFFVCGEDWSHESAEAALPAAITCGQEPLLVIGAIAGG